MAVGDIIKYKDIEIYRKLEQMKLGIKQSKKKSKIKLGDSIENLMSHSSYKRVNGALKQTRWGK